MIEEPNNSIVLGVPKGGVIVGDVIASKLGCEFDIIMSKRLRAPFNEEVGIGAITADGEIFVNHRLVRQLKISEIYIKKEISHQMQEVANRNLRYRNDRRDYKISGKTIILTDDGAATGATLTAAARWLQGKHSPKCVIIAIPVAPKNVVNQLRKEVHNVEVITSPSSHNFNFVDQFYRSFDDVPDSQVIEIMKKYST